MKRSFLFLLCTTFMLTYGIAMAETVKIPVGSQSTAQNNFPKTVSSKALVKSQFGEPL